MEVTRQQAVEAARALLPAWVGWVNVGLPLLLVFLLALTSIAGGAAVALALRERTPGDHWADRVRAAFPVRRAVSLAAATVFFIVAMVFEYFNGPLSPVSYGVILGWGHLPVTVGAATLVWRRVARRLGDGSRGWTFGNAAVYLLLILPQWIVIALVVILLPATPGMATIVLATGVVAVVFFFLGGGLVALHALGVARPASARLAAIVRATSDAVGIRPRRVYELRSSNANAYALPTIRHLAFTETALAVLDDEELAAVCAHELGHLAEPRLALAARCAEPLLVMAAAVLVSSDFDLGPDVLAAILLAAVATHLGLRRLRRRREAQADAVAHVHETAPGAHARALEKLHEVNRVPMVMRGRAHSHPDLYDRMAAAGAPVPPARPAPPARLPTIAGVSTAAAIATAFAFASIVGLGSGLASGTFDRRQNLWHIGVRGRGAQQLSVLGDLRWREGDAAEAITFRRAAVALDPSYAPELVQALAGDGRCDEAESVFATARRRLRSDPLLRSQDAIERCRAGANGNGSVP